MDVAQNCPKGEAGILGPIFPEFSIYELHVQQSIVLLTKVQEMTLDILVILSLGFGIEVHQI